MVCFFFLCIKDLVAARANIKFCIGDASRSKWSHVRPRAQQIMDQCLAYWKEKEPILASSDRWSDPERPHDVAQILHELLSGKASEEIKQMFSHDDNEDELLDDDENDDQHITAGDIWAASMNTQWFKTMDAIHQVLIAQEVQFAHVGFHIGESLRHGDSCLALLGA